MHLRLQNYIERLQCLFILFINKEIYIYYNDCNMRLAFNIHLLHTFCTMLIILNSLADGALTPFVAQSR